MAAWQPAVPHTYGALHEPGFSPTRGTARGKIIEKATFMKPVCESSRREHPSLDSVTFGTSGCTCSDDSDSRRTWVTPDGDILALFFYHKAPDLPVDARTPEELKAFYQGAVCSDRVRMIEFELAELERVPCVWMLLKVLREPHGATYLGSLTIPFESFSYVLKMQADEKGITGMRETALLFKAQSEGSVRFTADGELEGDFNPDDACFDSQFPDHPVSRLRRVFYGVRKSLRLSKEIKKKPHFPLPQNNVP